MKNYLKRLLKFYRPAASIVMVVFCIMLSAPAVFAFFDSKIESFSADMVFTSPDGHKAGSSKLYITPDKHRMDGIPGGIQQGIDMQNFSIISFRNKNEQYIYNHAKKLVFISDMDEMSMMKELSDYENEENEKVLGEEKISGYTCVKKQVASTSTVMGRTSTTTSIIWASDKFDFPLKVKSDDGIIMELRNIDTDDPPKKYFRPLAGYKKVDNIMALMGMDFSAMAMDDDDDGSDTEEYNDHASSRPDMEDLDIDEAMNSMEEILGNHMSREEMSRLRETIGGAFNRVKQMDTDAGAAGKLWQIIPKRPGDEIGKEFKAPNIYDVVLGSNSTLAEVCAFYKETLPSAGWENAGGFIHEDGKGFNRFRKGEDTLMIGYAEDPGMEGKFKYFYNIRFNGPDI